MLVIKSISVIIIVYSKDSLDFETFHLNYNFKLYFSAMIEALERLTLTDNNPNGCFQADVGYKASSELGIMAVDMKASGIESSFSKNEYPVTSWPECKQICIDTPGQTLLQSLYNIATFVLIS